MGAALVFKTPWLHGCRRLEESVQHTDEHDCSHCRRCRAVRGDRHPERPEHATKFCLLPGLSGFVTPNSPVASAMAVRMLIIMLDTLRNCLASMKALSSPPCRALARGGVGGTRVVTIALILRSHSLLWPFGS